MFGFLLAIAETVNISSKDVARPWGSFYCSRPELRLIRTNVAASLELLRIRLNYTLVWVSSLNIPFVPTFA